ncbi:MAG: hypothetical protein GY925_20645 [Actinomycetia bacterium]|nr:hypothetical protein [Actinomycetes bacterium]
MVGRRTAQGFRAGAALLVTVLLVTSMVAIPREAGAEPTDGASAPAPLAAESGSQGGYWMISESGNVWPFGGAINHGDVDDIAVPAGVAALIPTPWGVGYWILGRAGGLWAFGDAPSLAIPSSRITAGDDFTSGAATASGQGLWLFTERGDVVALGDAESFGDLTDFSLDGPIVAATTTPTGEGYYMIGSDGGVFSFGDAVFRGSVRGALGGRFPDAPVVGIVPTPDNKGYWLVGADGGLFSFGAPFKGSIPGVLAPGASLDKPINGMVAFGDAYLMSASDGGVFNFSNLAFFGSLGGRTIASPIVGIAAVPEVPPLPQVSQFVYNSGETDAPAIAFMDDGSTVAGLVGDDGLLTMFIEGPNGEQGTFTQTGSDGFRVDSDDGHSLLVTTEGTTATATLLKDGTVISEESFPVDTSDPGGAAAASATLTSSLGRPAGLAFKPGVTPTVDGGPGSARTASAFEHTIPVVGSYTLTRPVETTPIGQELWERVHAGQLAVSSLFCEFGNLRPDTQGACRGRARRLNSSTVAFDIFAVIPVPSEVSSSPIADSKECDKAEQGFTRVAGAGAGVIVGLVVNGLIGEGLVTAAAATGPLGLLLAALLGVAGGEAFSHAVSDNDDLCGAIREAVGVVKGLTTDANIEICLSVWGATPLDFGHGEAKLGNRCVSDKRDPFDTPSVVRSSSELHVDATQIPFSTYRSFAGSDFGDACSRPRDFETIGAFAVDVERVRAQNRRGVFQVTLKAAGESGDRVTPSDRCKGHLEVVAGSQTWDFEVVITVVAKGRKLALSARDFAQLRVDSNAKVACFSDDERRTSEPCPSGAGSSLNKSEILSMSDLGAVLSSERGGMVTMGRFELTASKGTRSYHIHAPADGSCSVGFSNNLTGNQFQKNVVAQSSEFCGDGSPVQMSVQKPTTVDVGDTASIGVTYSQGFFPLGPTSYQITAVIDGAQATTISVTQRSDTTSTSFLRLELPMGNKIGPREVTIYVADGFDLAAAESFTIDVTGPPECEGASSCGAVDPITVTRTAGDWSIWRTVVKSHVTAVCGTADSFVTTYTTSEYENWIMWTNTLLQDKLDERAAFAPFMNKWRLDNCSEVAYTETWEITPVATSVNEAWADQRWNQIADRLEDRGFARVGSRAPQYTMALDDDGDTGTIRVGQIKAGVAPS